MQDEYAGSGYPLVREDDVPQRDPLLGLLDFVTELRHFAAFCAVDFGKSSMCQGLITLQSTSGKRRVNGG